MTQIQLIEGESFNYDVSSKILTIITVEPPLPSDDFFFIWLSDTHIGRPFTFAPGEPQGLINHVVGLNPAFIIVTGDLVENGTIEQFQAFKALWPSVHPPLYLMSGNHDEPLTNSDPPPHQYGNYNQEIGQDRWAFSYGGYKFIGFTSKLKRDIPYKGFGWIDQVDTDYLQTELDSMNANEKALLFTHFPLHSSYGGNIYNCTDCGGIALRAILGQYQARIVGYFSGHRHVNMVPSYTGEVVKEINGSCSSYTLNNTRGGWQYVQVENGQFTFTHKRSVSPYETQTCTGIPNCSSVLEI